MDSQVLKKLLESVKNVSYFAIEYKNRFTPKEEHYLVIIGIPEDMRDLIYTSGIDTILYSHVERIKDWYIGQNIFIYPNFPPFQIGIKPFRYAVDILPLYDMLSTNLADILNSGAKSVWELEKFIKERTKTEDQ